jgi:hypothetical protein
MFFYSSNAVPPDLQHCLKEKLQPGNLVKTKQKSFNYVLPIGKCGEDGLMIEPSQCVVLWSFWSYYQSEREGEDGLMM